MCVTYDVFHDAKGLGLGLKIICVISVVYCTILPITKQAPIVSHYVHIVKAPVYAPSRRDSAYHVLCLLSTLCEYFYHTIYIVVDRLYIL